MHLRMLTGSSPSPPKSCRRIPLLSFNLGYKVISINNSNPLIWLKQGPTEWSYRELKYTKEWGVANHTGVCLSSFDVKTWWWWWYVCHPLQVTFGVVLFWCCVFLQAHLDLGKGKLLHLSGHFDKTANLYLASTCQGGDTSLFWTWGSFKVNIILHNGETKAVGWN